MTLPLPWTITAGQPGEVLDTQTAYRLLMPAAQQLAMGFIAADTFTRPDSATLDNAETGQAWTVQAGSFAVAGGAVTSSSTSVAVLDVGRANVDVLCDVTMTSGSSGVAFRAGTTSADRLAVQLDMTNGELRLQKTDTNVLTVLTAATQAFTAGQVYELRVVSIGDKIWAYLDGGDPKIDGYQLSAGEQTKYGALTRVGLRNSGVAAFDNFAVRTAYPSTGGGSSPTLSNIPAGSTLTVVESGGAYIRPTARTDVIVIFEGTTNPGSAALENDIWARTP